MCFPLLVRTLLRKSVRLVLFVTLIPTQKRVRRITTLTIVRLRLIRLSVVVSRLSLVRRRFLWFCRRLRALLVINQSRVTSGRPFRRVYRTRVLLISLLAKRRLRVIWSHLTFWFGLRRCFRTTIPSLRRKSMTPRLATCTSLLASLL